MSATTSTVPTTSVCEPLTGRAAEIDDRDGLPLVFLADPARVSAADVERLDEPLRALHTERDPERIVRVSTAAAAVDRVARCRAVLWRVIEGGRRGGAIVPAVRALTLLAADDVGTGRWDEGVALAHEATELAARHGHRTLAAAARPLRARIAAARGDTTTVRVLADETIAWAEPRGLRAIQRASAHTLALAALADGDAERAHHHTRAVGAAGDLPPHDAVAVLAAMDLVEAACRSGRRDDAARHAQAMRDAPLAAASARFAMVSAGATGMAASPDPSAADAFEAALAVPGGERWSFERARIQLAYGEHLRRRRRTGPAREHLDAAWATFDWLGAEPWTRRARAELRAVGCPKDTRSGHDRRHVTLSAQEREVASLAAAGLTNKQIAQRLHVSHRTVSGRLYQLFPKLDVTTRAGLPDALASLSASLGQPA